MQMVSAAGRFMSFQGTDRLRLQRRSSAASFLLLPWLPRTLAGPALAAPGLKGMVLPTQGMMLSERPSAGTSDSTATAGAGTPLTGAGSIGNYKGVMLCNRPFAGTAAAAKGVDVAAAAGKNVFVTGKVKSEVGFAGKSLQTEKLLRKRVKQETALTRHRKWLADLQLTKQALEEQYIEDLRQKEENKRRFAEREARMRQMTRELALEESKSGGGRGGDGGSEERGSQAWAIGLDGELDEAGKKIAAQYRPSKLEHDEKSGGEEEMKAQSEEVVSRVDPAELRAVEKRRKRNGKPCRPMWAMTEAKAEAEDELKHEQELEELLEFTQGLDFGKYIRDAEVQSMIDQVKKRISEIEEQPEVDEGVDDDDRVEGSTGDQDGQDEAEARLEAKIMKLTDKNLRDMETLNGGGASTGTDNEQDDDNISVARTVLSAGGRSVRSVHSARSLASVAERARLGIVQARAEGRDSAPARLESLSEGGSELNDSAVNDIVVVTHKEDGGLRLGGKNTVSNLPYIRRNPAV